MVDVTPAELRREPQTLEDVQAGDEVLWSDWLEYSRHRVIRTTPTLIVTEGGAWFRNNGSPRTGLIWGGSHIAVGAVAAWLVEEIDRFAEVRRAACDAAEAALRELGEWEDA